ncbi:hypothetical protein BJ878DRAFT_538311 [Calycina marina]|uniref:MARVEL domain-containing protein n=1 Tax=Calycina marina TaxID=1763456 RepID=A0A9P8CJ05_9HELO|nr:hypothetical protein BJ878DRAFT_538311 [Calycina marina]
MEDLEAQNTQKTDQIGKNRFIMKAYIKEPDNNSSLSLNQGYGPLGMALFVVRILQNIALFIVVAITAWFISDIQVLGAQKTPGVLTGVLSVACVAWISIILTLLAYLNNRPWFLYYAGLDAGIFIMIAVIAGLVGKPITSKDCSTIIAPASAAPTIGTESYDAWVVSSEHICFKMKSVWGFNIALVILFLFSAACCLLMSTAKRVQTLEGGDLEMAVKKTRAEKKAAKAQKKLENKPAKDATVMEGAEVDDTPLESNISPFPVDPPATANAPAWPETASGDNGNIEGSGSGNNPGQ